MKAKTPFLLRFALTATGLTIIFRYFLSFGIEDGSSIAIILSAVIYGIAMFIGGLYFGRKDGAYLPVYDVGFRFHFVTYLVHNLISVLWFAFGLNSHYEQIETVYATAIIWGIFLIIHFIFFLWARKNSINSLNKEDLFE
ncbi:hypothetical protein [Parapedobacter pyrenivorans]|uniref:hypothetical protein n=1 Tax=Parapedobacter pyrenivorans TaxID=1305674 RepID=UPI0033413DE0